MTLSTLRRRLLGLTITSLLPLASFGQTNVLIESQLNDMSIEEKVGQMLLLGVNGQSQNDFNRRKLRELRPGGVIFFGRNIKTAKQVSSFISSLQTEAQRLELPPLFVAVDQEGGNVTRLKSWPPMPSAAAVGRSRSRDLAFKLSFFTGQVLRTLGFNMNLAPVLDLSDPYEKTFIGSRAYGGEPEEVARMGAAVIAGYKASGVVTIAKHFPGHGGLTSDSHRVLPTTNRILSELLQTDVVPFANVSSLISGLMVAHISFPKIDRSNVPATYSSVLLQDLLRRQLHYDGLVMTDDLEMIGAKGIGDAGERAVRAILAGADIVMVAWNPGSQEKAFEALLRAVRQGRITQERLNDSTRRILAAKNSFGLANDFSPPSEKALELMVHHRELHSTINRIVENNIRLSSLDFPDHFFHSDREFLVISDDKKFAESLRIAAGRARLRFLGFNEDTLPAAIADRVRNFPSHYSIILYAGRPKSVVLANKLPLAVRSRLFLVTPELPYLVRNASSYRGVFFSYSRHPDLGSLLFSSLDKKADVENRTPASAERSENGRKDSE